MMCGCGQGAGTTHACALLNGPLCSCGQPANQTHSHPGWPVLTILAPPWYRFPIPVAPPSGER
jgi:hypothetical protein